MANPTLDNLAAAVTKIEGVADSAIALINGIAARIQAAVDAAIAGGASAADFAPGQAEEDGLNAKADALAAPVAANP